MKVEVMAALMVGLAAVGSAHAPLGAQQSVWDGVYTMDGSALHATWTSSDPESGIAEYEYQIRSTALDGILVVDWTSTGTTPEVVELGNGMTEDDLLTHDEAREDPAIAFIMARMQWPDYPVPLGILRAVEHATYNDLLDGQIQDAIAQHGKGDLAALYAEGDTWTVD